MLHLLALVRAAASSPRYATLIDWIGRLVTRALARQLQMPEILVRETGLYLYRRVDSIERRVLARLASLAAK